MQKCRRIFFNQTISKPHFFIGSLLFSKMKQPYLKYNSRKNDIFQPHYNLNRPALTIQRDLTPTEIMLKLKNTHKHNTKYEKGHKSKV